MKQKSGQIPLAALLTLFAYLVTADLFAQPNGLPNRQPLGQYLATSFQDTGGAGAQLQGGGVPGVDLSSLNDNQRERFFSILGSERCTCGCGYTMLQCRIQDASCPVSLQRAQQLVAQLSALRKPPSASQPDRGTAAPVSIVQLQGRYCTAFAPTGWTITAENPAGSAFGADILRADGAAGAGYIIMGITAEMRSSPWYGPLYGTPEQAIMTIVTKYGTAPMQCGQPKEFYAGTGVKLMECQNATTAGVALYQTYPMGDGGYILVARTAGTPPTEWKQLGPIATAVARSIRCNVPLKPSTTDWTSSSPGSKKRSQGEKDSGYSQWLEMEYYHDPSTGENYWVSPSRHWMENGPQGPGYYLSVGNELRQLQPGLAE